MADEFTTAEYLDTTKTLGAMTELILLDRFWTQEAMAASGEDPAVRHPARLEGLDSLVAEVERQLVNVELLSRRIAVISRRRSVALQANFAALTGNESPFTPRQRDKVAELVNTRSGGDLSAFVDAVVADVAAQLEPERNLLKGELDRIKKGGLSDGDFSAEEERALAELAVLASLAFGPEAGVIVEAVGHLLDWLFG